MSFFSRLFGKGASDAWQQPLFEALFLALIRNLPSHWNGAVLTLEAPPQGLGHGVSRSIRSPEGHLDIVSPSEDLLRATRKVELAFKKRGMLWKRATIRMQKDGE